MAEGTIRRLDQLLKTYDCHQTYQVRVEDLETVLATSRRNVALIVNRLVECDWIVWQPAVGRGQCSTLKIRVSLYDAVYQTIFDELKDERFELISKLIAQYRDVAVKALAQAMEVASMQYQSEDKILITQYPWVDQLCPRTTFRQSELQIIRSVYDTLFKIDAQGQLRTHLLRDYRFEGGKLTMWLRPDVYRHDGQLLTVEDVIYSLRQLKTVCGPVRHLYSDIRYIEAGPEPFCIELGLATNNPLFLYTLCTPSAAITCRDVMEFGPRRVAPIGTGPFSIHHWDRSGLQLSKHLSYFGKSALVESVVLRHDGDILTEGMSYNIVDSDCEIHQLQSMSYLTVHERCHDRLSGEEWEALLTYIEAERQRLAEWPMNPMRLPGAERLSAHSAPCPSLSGTFTLAHPKWTLPYLSATCRWLCEVLTQAGLTVKTIELTDVSSPESVSDRADFLFLEEVFESPYHYGVYEWLLTASGLRFAWDDTRLSQHVAAVHQRLGSVSSETIQMSLLDTLATLRKQRSIVPLFYGIETVSAARHIKGIQVNASGYSDFYKLWVSHSR